MWRWSLVLMIPALGSCVPPVPAPARPVPTPAPAPPAPLASDWRDWPLSAGDWRYRAGIAWFGGDWQTQQLSLRCDPAARELVLSRVAPPGAVPATMIVRTTSLTRVLPAPVWTEADGWPPRVYRATLSATDPLLDAIAFSRGRFVVEGAGAPLVVPAWAEIGRVIEDCRG